MWHPLLEDLKTISDDELRNQISTLRQELLRAHQLQRNLNVLGQMQVILASYEEEYQDRLLVAMNEEAKKKQQEQADRQRFERINYGQGQEVEEQELRQQGRTSQRFEKVEESPPSRAEGESDD